ncbi:MAG: SLC13 family permease [Deltaproteobacteria bacterium]|nr:MAG: SLC13 family permease [Deltaproteobacteria bacterium]
MPEVCSILALAVVLVAMGLFVTAKLEVDVIALCVLVTLIVLGLIDPNQALYGFASPATATVTAMFVLSAGLVRTGLVEWLSRQLNRLAGKGEMRLIVVLCIAIAFLSAFLVNTATVAIFIPVATVLAMKRRVSPSHVLMPLSFASQFGGVCTLIGTSTNILVNSIAVSKGMQAFGLFDFAPLGMAMSATGILYFILIGRRLLPRRKVATEQVDKYRLADYLAELSVAEQSPLIGQTWDKRRASRGTKVELIKIMRGEKAVSRPSRTIIREGDILLIHGNVDKLISIKEKLGLGIQAHVTMDDQELSSHEVRLVEVLVPPRSSLVGRTLRSSGFIRRYRSVVLAVQRRGRILRDRLRDIRLYGGDSLLLQVNNKDLARLMKASEVIVTNELTDLYLRKDRAVTALLIFLGVLTLTALKIVPILAAALMGAVGMVVSRCLTIEEAYDAIDWKVVFLLGGIIPLGLALEQSGAARWLAESVLAPFADFGPLMVLAALYLFTAILTEVMSNNASAVILAPIAFSLAASMHVSARPFLVAITFAASTSFATPVGYQTNTMVYAPGGYQFTDYTRVGGPLNLIFCAVALLLIPMLWPF